MSKINKKPVLNKPCAAPRFVFEGLVLDGQTYSINYISDTILHAVIVAKCAKMHVKRMFLVYANVFAIIRIIIITLLLLSCAVLLIIFFIFFCRLKWNENKYKTLAHSTAIGVGTSKKLILSIPKMS